MKENKFLEVLVHCLSAISLLSGCAGRQQSTPPDAFAQIVEESPQVHPGDQTVARLDPAHQSDIIRKNVGQLIAAHLPAAKATFEKYLRDNNFQCYPANAVSDVCVYERLIQIKPPALFRDTYHSATIIATVGIDKGLAVESRNVVYYAIVTTNDTQAPTDRKPQP